MPEIFAFRSFGAVLMDRRGEMNPDPEQRERQYDCEPRPGFFCGTAGEKGKGLLQKAGLGATPAGSGG